MVVRFNRSALITASKEPASAIGVEGDITSEGETKKISETEKIVSEAKRKVEADGGVGVGISGSNSGRGHDPVISPEPAPNPAADIPVLNDPPPPKNTSSDEGGVPEKEKEELAKVVEEEPTLVDGHDSKEVDLKGGEAASPDTREKLSLPK